MGSLKTRLKNIEKDFDQQLKSLSAPQQLTSLKTSFLGRKRTHQPTILGTSICRQSQVWTRNKPAQKSHRRKNSLFQEKKLLQNKKEDSSFDPTIPALLHPKAITTSSPKQSRRLNKSLKPLVLFVAAILK